MNHNLKTTLVGAAMLTVGAVGTNALVGSSPAPLDCKGQECQVQVIVSEPNFRDAIYYKPDDWNQKTAPEIEAETQERYDNWKALVEEQSKQSSPDEN